jgi:hypothetical protein
MIGKPAALVYDKNTRPAGPAGSVIGEVSG